jgi:hypothetical protein
MEDRAETLRRRIAYYRRRLAEGVESDWARRFLYEIITDEAELAQSNKGTDRRG